MTISLKFPALSAHVFQEIRNAAAFYVIMHLLKCKLTFFLSICPACKQGQYPQLTWAAVWVFHHPGVQTSHHFEWLQGITWCRQSGHFRDFISVYSMCLLLGTIRAWCKWQKNYYQYFYGRSKNSWCLEKLKEYPTECMPQCSFLVTVWRWNEALSSSLYCNRTYNLNYIICNNYKTSSHEISVKIMFFFWVSRY